jgi:hypothetical protein
MNGAPPGGIFPPKRSIGVIRLYFGIIGRAVLVSKP